MLRDFLAFVAALWHEWAVLLTGGSIIALLSLWNFAGRKPVPQSANWLIVGITFILASFLAWRKQYLDADKDFISRSPLELMQLIEDYSLDKS